MKSASVRCCTWAVEIENEIAIRGKIHRAVRVEQTYPARRRSAIVPGGNHAGSKIPRVGADRYRIAITIEGRFLILERRIANRDTLP